MNPDEIKALRAELEKGNQEILVKHNELKGLIQKANDEAAASGKMSAETKGQLEGLSEKLSGLIDRMVAAEQKLANPSGLIIRPDSGKSLGDMFAESEDMKALANGKTGRATFEVKGGFSRLMTKADEMLNATQTTGQPLVAEHRVPGIVAPMQRRLTIRDLLGQGRTASNVVFFAKENVFTDNAGPQYSSPAREGVTKPQSKITFTSAEALVVTLAHFFLVSKQVLEDAPMLASYINERGLYALKLEEEDELLNGAGTSGKIGGLLKSGNYTAYDRGQTGDTMIDTLRRSLTQVQLSEFDPDAIVLNPEDWEEICLIKDEQGRYVYGGPERAAAPQLWGYPVVPTQSITAGTFLTGAFKMGATVWDRQQATVGISTEDAENFRKNLVTILFEERLALTVFRPLAFVSGSF